MCGINGIALASASKAKLDESTLVRMRDVLHHRGPDDSGHVIDGPIGLAHRRLSIVDLESGQQPIKDQSGSIHLVFNGEIYNHEDYRNKLEALGHTFQTKSDTEVILHLYDEYGEACVDHLRGMFAFAIWDARKSRLFIARDRLGIKPLYYHTGEDGSLYFASEIKAILAANVTDARMNVAVLPDLLTNLSPSAEDTLYQSIQRLPGGCTLTWQDGKLDIQRYWDVTFSGERKSSAGSESKLIEEWRGKFEDAVSSHLMSDVPVGVLLSGGIDSTAIAAMMRKNMQGKVHGFSVAFEDKSANELHYAGVASKAFELDAHVVKMSSSEYFELLPRMIWHEDEPIAYPASIPLFRVCELASEHVKVVLTGEGADELMAGYGRYPRTVYNFKLGQYYKRLTPAALRRAISRLVSRAQGNRVGQKLSRTFLQRELGLEQLYFDNFSAFSNDELHRTLSADLKESIGAIDPYRQHAKLAAAAGSPELLDKILYVDMWTYLHELLMKQDQMSMAASIESRVPFLDRELVEFTTHLPTNMKLRRLTTKYVLRKAMEGVIPSEILHRPKMGFPVPLATWFRQKHSNLLDEFVLGERFRSRNILDNHFIETVCRNHREQVSDNSQTLWGLLNLEIWLRIAIDGESHELVGDRIRELNSN